MLFRISRFSAWPASASLCLVLAAMLPTAAGAAASGAFRTVWTTSDGAPPAIHQIAQDGKGWLWLASQAGLYRFDGERFERLAAIDGNKLRRNAIASVAVLDGVLWVGYQAGGIERFQDGVATYFDESSGLPRSAVTQFVRARGGPVSAATANGLFEWDGKRWNATWPRAKAAQDAAVQSLAVARDNSLLLASTRGGASEWWLRAAGKDEFVRVEEPASTADGKPVDIPARAPGSEPVIAAFTDREGNLWLGTSGALERLRPNRAHTVELPKEIRAPGVALQGRSAIVASTADAAALRRVAASGDVDARGLPEAQLVVAGRQGAVWAADATRVLRLDEGTAQQWELPAAGTQPQSLAEDKAGGLWMSLKGKRELQRLHDGKWVNHRELMGYPEAATLLHVDAQDRLWQAYPDSRLAVAAGSAVTRYSAKDGLRTGDISSIATRGGDVWVGGEAALMLLREGSFVGVTARDGSDFLGITGIVATAQGELWLHGLQGVTHIGAAEVKRVLAGGAPQVAFERFDGKDGIAGLAMLGRALPTLHEGADGLIWYNTATSVGWIDPRDDVRGPLAPPLQVRGVATPAGHYAPAAGMQLPEGTRDVRIDYAAPLLSMPERLRFRYKLDGVDADWVDAGASRSARYTQLGAGDYHFQVQAVSENGVWNTAGAIQEFSIAPTLTEMAWLRGACVALLLAALALLHRWRLRGQAARLRARMVARLDERTRIAHEVHDTLVQPVQALMLKVRDAAACLSPQEPVRAALDAALADADSALAHGRGRLRELRSRAEGRDLPMLFEAVGREVGGEAGAALAVQVTGTVRELAPGVGGELFQIGREAIVNAYRHAGASKIAVLIEYGPRQLRLAVSDDGAGIADALTVDAGGAGSAGHWGIAGMRERAGRLGAALAWRRPAAGGTECELTVRGRKAYDSRRGRWRRWWR